MSGSICSLPPDRKDSDADAGVGSFADGQAQFAGAILDPLAALPTGLVGPDGRPSAKRFAVYRNNVIAGLIETLKAAYPVIHRLVGEEFFAAMAGLYARAEPPATPIMLDYGAGFPRFIGQFEPAAALPYLQDVARLERGWVEAYHAVDAPPLTLAGFSRVLPGDLPTLRLVLHPSIRVVRSTFPIMKIWQTNVDGHAVVPIDLNAGGDDVLIARPDMDVEVRRLPVGVAAFIEALQAGVAIEDAAAGALAASLRFDLAGALRGMIETGIIIGYDVRAAGQMEAA